MIPPNTQIGPYSILEKLGEGGMGEVFKARDTRLNRFVAVKALPPDKVSDPQRRQRFLQEAQASSALNHPNIITIHDWVEQNGGFYLVMEYVSGKTLDQLIPKKGVRLADVLKYSVQIADALSAAHAAGIVHRDIKPANIMVSDQGRVKVLDFGLAKLEELSPIAQDEATLTARAVSAEGTVAGSAPYMSPEQAEGKKIDARSDIFSFGAVLYEMVTGQRAFRGDSRASTMAAVLKSEPKPAAQLAEALPKELDRIISRCLRKDLDRRSQSIAEIKLALEEIREESESGVQPAAAPPLSRREGPGAGVLAAAGLAAIAVIGAGIWAVTRQRSTAAPAYRLKPVNQDGAEVSSAAVSLDGKLIVYTSARGGQPDLWIQHLAGGSPSRLTNSPEPERGPRFSPDGSQIAFARAQSIFVISTLGGSERPIPAGGSMPSFSPDGTQLLVPNEGLTGRLGPMVAVPLAGGAPRRIPLPREFPAISLWSPSGRHILVGTIQPGSSVRLDQHWHIVNVADGSSRPAGEFEQAIGMFQRDSVRPVSWLKQSNHLIFAAQKPGDQTQHIWRLEMDEDGQVASPPVQLTNGTGESPGPASADGGLIPFVNRIRTSGIYSITLDSAGKGGAEPAPIAGLDGQADFAVVSRDGSRLVYAANASGSRDIWLRDMKTGTETVLIGSPANEVRGLVSPDGSKVAFQRNQGNQSAAYWTTIPAGEEHRICDDCRSLLHWTPAGRAVLVSQGKPERMVAYETDGARRIPTVADPQFPVHDVTFSRDGRFLAFTVLRRPGDRSIYVARWDQSRETGPAEWSKVLDGHEPGRPFFSEDGNLLYYVKWHAGTYCLFARRLHPVTKVPQGEEIEIRHFHGDLKLPNQRAVGYGLVGNTLYLPLYQSRSSLWIAERAVD